MSKRANKANRANHLAARSQVRGDQLQVPLSSGYTLIVRRPTLGMIEALQTKADELYPLPEPPTATLETLTGPVRYALDIPVHFVQQFQAGQVRDIPPAVRSYLTEMHTAQALQWNHLLEYMLQKRVDVLGYEGDEGRAQLVAELQDDLDELREWGSLGDWADELDEFQIVLRQFVLGDQSDWFAMTVLIGRAAQVEDIDPEEVQQRATFFQR